MKTFESSTKNKTKINASVNAPARFTSQKHPYHILSASAFPVLTSLFLLCLLIPQVFLLHGWYDELPRSTLLHGFALALLSTMRSWFRSIIQEAAQGFHTKRVQKGLRLGRLLFIASEVRFFFAFFWAFFHFSLVPAITIGAVWPPAGTQALSPWGLPLVNTLLLLSSGVTITIAHAYIVRNNKRGFAWYLLLTIGLGCVFLFCQAYEYKYGVKFSWRDNVYGSIFYITTGFHGFHVTVGTVFLLFCWLRHYVSHTLPVGVTLLSWALRRYLNALTFSRAGFAAFCVKNAVTGKATLKDYVHSLKFNWSSLKYYGFTPGHHFGFEAAAWYWHFVDVVWLFLFLTVYWWGGV